MLRSSYSVFAVLFCTVAVAQNTTEVEHQPANSSVVTVTATPLPVETTPASITVLGRDFIASSHAANAAELLREAPFVQFSQTGGAGGLSTVTIRGGKPNFTLVMIDGIPVNDLTNLLGGSFDLSTLALDNIDHIEIIRGPLSSIYGSDAIGGVINIISRRGTKTTSLDFSGELGNFFQREAQLGFSGTYSRFEYSLAGSCLRIGEQITDDAYGLGNVALHSDVTLTKTQLLELTARYDNKQSAGFPSNGGGPEFSILRTPQADHSSQMILGISYKGQFRPWWMYSVDADRFVSGERNFTPAILDQIPPSFQSIPSSSSNNEFTRNRVGAASQFRLPSHLLLNLASTLRHEQGDVSAVLNETIPASFHLRRTILQAGPELLYTSSSLTATAAVGFDKSSGLGVEVSPSLGVNYLAKWGTRFKASWAKGFKLPSLYALGNPLVGNSGLQPEHSRSFDAGVEQKISSRMIVNATYFRDDFTNLVDFSATLFRLVNRSQAKTQGAEFSTEYVVRRDLRLGAYLSYIDWMLKNTAEPLRDVPRWSGGTSIQWTFRNRLQTNLASQWIGRRYDFSVPLPNQTTVGGYSNTNLSASYAFSDSLIAYLRAENLFSSHYHEFIGFPSPGVTVRAGMHYTFFRHKRSRPARAS